MTTLNGKIPYMAGMGERIREARGAMSQRQLAREVGVSHQTVGFWEADENEPKRDNLRNLSAVLGVSEEWLISGKGPSSSGNVKPGPRIRGLVPIISWIQAGELSETLDTQQLEAAASLPCPVAHGPRTYALRVDGDSMTSPHGRTYPDGCIIFVDPDDAGVVVSGDRVVARLSFGNTVTFKVYVEDGGRQLLKPLNSHYPMIDTPFRIIGKVLGQFSE